jgi:CubicO group peptidase (beta-lactamase class C family)
MASGHAGIADSSGLSDRVADVVQPYLAQGDFPGISVAVVTDGQVSLAQGYGTSNVSNGARVDANTRVDIGSVTKTFTALGVLLLYQESHGTSRPLDLDAPIGDYLHNTRTFKLPKAWSQVTVRELLAMSSGIRNVETGHSWQAQLRSIARYPLRFTPGSATAYSDSNYYLLGELIEQWTGESYGAFIQSRILDPLGMSSTQELGRSSTVSNQAVGYNALRHGHWPKAKLWNGSAMYASAGMISTAQDMGTYMTALLAGRILDSSTYATMWTSIPSTQFGADLDTATTRGLGWDAAIDTSSGVEKVAKAGQVPGFTSQLILFPSSHTGVFVSINMAQSSDGDRSGAIADQIAESIYQAIRPDSGT